MLGNSTSSFANTSIVHAGSRSLSLTPSAPLHVLLPPGNTGLVRSSKERQPKKVFRPGTRIRQVPAHWTHEQETQHYLTLLRRDVLAKGGRLPEPVASPVSQLETSPVPESWWAWLQTKVTTVVNAMARYEANAWLPRRPHQNIQRLMERAQDLFQVELLKGVKATDSLAGCIVLVATYAEHHPRVPATVHDLLDGVAVPGDRCLLPLPDASADVHRLCPSTPSKEAGMCHGIDLPFGWGVDADLVRLRQQAWDLLVPLAMGLALPPPRNDLLDPQADQTALRHVRMLLEVAQSHWAQGSPLQRQALELAEERVIRFLDAWQAVEADRCRGAGLKSRQAHMHQQILNHRPGKFQATYVVLPGEHVDRLRKTLMVEDGLKLVVVRPTIRLIPPLEDQADHARALNDRITVTLARQRALIEQRIESLGVPQPAESGAG